MKAKQSPLFEPVLWDGEGFKILDETLLPGKSEYIDVREPAEALAAVRDMKTRAFGQVLTFFYAAALAARRARGETNAELKTRMTRLADAFTEARPTFDFKALAKYFEPWLDAPPSGQEAGGWFADKILELVAGIAKARTHRAKMAAALLPDDCRLLTHCNVSGELVAVALWRREMGKKLSVIATETRPYLQGSRLTAWELGEAGVDVQLIPDGAIAQVIAGGKVNAVMVGADRSARNGDIINKVGTYPIAVVAQEFGVPFYALVQDPGGLQSGADVEIEERPAAELFQLQGRALVEGPIEGRYPSFDVTPAHLIARLIGFDGVYTPEEFRQKYRPEISPAAGKKSPAGHILLYGVPNPSEYKSLARSLRLEKAEHILTAEMRPELWGLHFVAKEMKAQNLPVEIISDNMMGTFFAQGAIRRLYLYYSEVGAEGPVGVCGSLTAVLLARAHGVPIELIAGEKVSAAPVDRDVSTFMGERVAPEGAALYPLAPEVIPWPLFQDKKEKR
ncbi:MAG TPA: hypothetical protein VGA73_03375 [Candidatus Binatia bacterium]